MQNAQQKEIYIEYCYNYYVIRVDRSYSLKFRGDVYSYYMLKNSTKLKTYSAFRGNVIELLQDKYNRLWYHVCYVDIWEDRVEEIFDLVESEKEADELCDKKGGGPSYMGSLPYFFASENPDFILHEDPMEETLGYIENKRKEIMLLNQ